MAILAPNKKSISKITLSHHKQCKIGTKVLQFVHNKEKECPVKILMISSILKNLERLKIIYLWLGKIEVILI
jgi:hypothetical protein